MISVELLESSVLKYGAQGSWKCHTETPEKVQRKVAKFVIPGQGHRKGKKSTYRVGNRRKDKN